MVGLCTKGFDHKLLFFAGQDRIDRTLIGTGSTVGTEAGINDVPAIFLADRSGGAYIRTGATG